MLEAHMVVHSIFATLSRSNIGCCEQPAFSSVLVRDRQFFVRSGERVSSLDFVEFSPFLLIDFIQFPFNYLHAVMFLFLPLFFFFYFVHLLLYYFLHSVLTANCTKNVAFFPSCKITCCNIPRYRRSTFATPYLIVNFL